MTRLTTSLPPEAILHTPALNKGTAFTKEERHDLGLNGLLPPHVSTIEEQLARRLKNFQECKTEMGRFKMLSSLQNRNEVLFYRFILEHAEEALPYLYTPTVGDYSLDFSNLYVKNRGLFLSYEDREHIDEIFNAYEEEVSVIVVTDGSRILGLGDLGVGGMGIPVGKLTLYSLFGGIHPAKTLPIVLDVGTNNEELLADPLYLGLRQKRIEGDAYYAFIADVVDAVKRRWPDVLLQWEDFRKPYAQNLLRDYQKEICSFNDDIQGTAAVTLAALLSAVDKSGIPLKEHRFAIVGAGAAGTGIASMISQKLGGKKDHFYLFDRNGLIDKNSDPDAHQKPFAQKQGGGKSLLEVMESDHPTVLIGVSGQAGAFTEEVIRAMAKHCKRPIIFPLSNPTSHAEATPHDLFQWTDGQCIVATGSPFDPVNYNGKSHPIPQCNNVYIFPGVGLGIIASKTREVTDAMFIKAAEVLAKEGGEAIFPPIDRLREVSRKIALAFADEVAVDAEIWDPAYTRLHRS